MKDLLSMADLAMWMALIAGKVFLCVCVFAKRFYRRLPWFSSYIIASTIKSLALVCIAFLGSYKSYYYAFYITGHFESILAFVTLIECGRQILPGLDLPKKEKAIAWLLAVCGGVIVFAVLWPLHFVENRLEVGACLGIAVAFIFIAAYSRYLGLYWSRLLAGMTATLGLFYLVEGVTRAVSFHYASILTHQVRQISQIVNFLAVVAWTAVILSPWEEHKLTEEGLLTYQQIVDEIEENVRNFATGGQGKNEVLERGPQAG